MSDQEITFGGFRGNINGNLTTDKSVEELDPDEEGYASTISLYYSEEEPYYHYDDDSCDEDRAQDECDVNEQRVPDSKMENDYDYEDFYPKEAVLNDYDFYPKVAASNDYDEFYPKVAAFKVSKPSKDMWVKTWPKEDNKVWVSVYGWHNEIEGYGAYAVIVRNMSAKPITASARFSESSVSYLHQVLKGLKAGLDLASEHGCSSPRVLCNSRLVTQLLNNRCSCEIKTVSSTICKICMSNIFSHLGKVYVSKLVPLIETLQTQRGSSTFEWDSMNHEAVHYLAKMVKRTAMKYGRRVYKTVMKEPEEFPNELVDILWHDAYDGTAYFNLDERVQGSITNADKGFVTNAASDFLTDPAGCNGEDEDVNQTAGGRCEGNMSTISDEVIGGVVSTIKHLSL